MFTARCSVFFLTHGVL